MSPSVANIPPLPEGNIALFVDIDGTVAPIAPTPEAAEIPGETLAILRMLRQYADGAVAFISGRTLEDIDRLSGGGFAAAGQHGLELRQANGRIERYDEQRPLIARISDELASFQRNHPRLLIEPKGLSVAVHFRQAPELAPLVEQTMSAIAARHPDILRLQRGKMVCELRAAQSSKGEAIRQLLSASPFEGRLSIFAGDDLTDEEGFTAVNAMGGISIKVGPGQTAARWRVENPDQLCTWLRRLALHIAPNLQQTGTR